MADHGVTLVGKGGRHRRHGGHHHRRRHHGHNNFFWAAPLIAALFLYNGYSDYGYSNYGYGGGGNSCYRACRYENGPRYCRYNWEDYC